MFLQVRWPNQQCQSTVVVSYPDSSQSHQAHLTLGRAVSKKYKLVKLRQECYQSYHCDFTIVTIWLLLNEDASWNKQSVIGRLFGAGNRPKHYRCTSTKNAARWRHSELQVPAAPPALLAQVKVHSTQQNIRLYRRHTYDHSNHAKAAAMLRSGSATQVTTRNLS